MHMTTTLDAQPAIRTRIATSPEFLARFWSKVDRSGGPDACWPWLASKRSSGYGQIALGGTVVGAHRVAWEIANGPVPDGLSVCHNCPDRDDPSCVNPAHLWLGTQKENVADTIDKGRKMGRPPRYGSRAWQQAIYVPTHLRDRIRHEARLRNIRDNTDAWNFSSVIVEILAAHFDMDLMPQENSNGH